MYEIRRGLVSGRNLTPAQRTSSLFAEEPVVLGKVLRRGGGPLRISDESYELNKMKLLRLEKTGSIVIVRPQAVDPEETATPPEVIVPPHPGSEPTPPGGTPVPEPETPAPEQPKEEPPAEEPAKEDPKPEEPAKEEPKPEEPSTSTPAPEETAPAASIERPRKRGRKE